MNKASGSDEIPVVLFQIINRDAVKILPSICQQILKTQQWPKEWKRSVFISVPKKGNANEFSKYQTIAVISQASRGMLKNQTTRIGREIISTEQLQFYLETE